MDGSSWWVKIGRKEYILEVDFKRRIVAILTMNKRGATKILWRSDEV